MRRIGKKLRLLRTIKKKKETGLDEFVKNLIFVTRYVGSDDGSQNEKEVIN